MNTTYQALIKWTSTLIIGGVIIYLLYNLASVILYLILAGVLALLGKPIVSFFDNKLAIPTSLSVVITILLQIALVLGFAGLIIPVVLTQGENLSLLDIESLEQNITDSLSLLSDTIARHVPPLKNYLNELSIENQFVENMDLNFIPNLLGGVLDALGTLSIGFFSVVFITFFFLKDQKLLQRGILVFIPDNKEEKAVNSFGKISYLLSRYFSGILLQLIILFIVYSITLLIGGIENAIVIALLCSIFNIIPYVGPLIGGTLMLLLTLISYLEVDFYQVALPKLAYVAAGIIVGQLIDNFFSQPYIYAKSVKSHPLEIFLVILCAGSLFGILGMVVAVPAYTVIKVILSVFFADHPTVVKFTKGL
jgi:predicted PurR-regulated permease PerM